MTSTNAAGRIARRLPTLFALLVAAAALLVTRHATADEIAIIVNPASGVDSLSPEDLARIFLGRAKTFPNGKSATPVNQPAESPVRTVFDQTLLGKSQSQIKAYWATQMFTGAGVPPPEVADDAAVVAKVASDATAIGYVPASKVTGDVKVVLKK